MPTESLNTNSNQASGFIDPSSKPLKETLPKDLLSGVVVALVALPLCLGIASASGAPLISGLIAGIVGGLVVSWVSGSHTSVSGPAAALIAVVYAQITDLGFEAFLPAVILAGVFQIVLGAVRAGDLARYFPNSVIKGLLAAIGLIIIIKQVPVLFGLTPDNFLSSFGELHQGATFIGVVSLAALWGWGFTPLKKIPLPPALFVAIATVGLSYVLASMGDAWILQQSHLVDIPMADSFSGLVAKLPSPDYSSFSNVNIWMAAVTICIVASISTLLNLEATDDLDPKNRKSPANRELVAQGVGNMVSGFIGGLPLTSVIIRSSVNISSGCETRNSSVIHGVFLVMAVVLFPMAINKIPLACLAGILTVTGFKLASPKLFVTMWRGGMVRFVPFVATVSAIVLTDLLKGIIVGLVVAYSMMKLMGEPEDAGGDATDGASVIDGAEA